MIGLRSDVAFLDSVASIATYRGGSKVIFVRSTGTTGGIYYLYTDADPVDGVTVIAGADSTKWKRYPSIWPESSLLTSTRIPFASGTNTVIDSASLAYNNSLKTLLLAGNNAADTNPVLRLTNTVAGGNKRFIQIDELAPYNTGGRTSVPFTVEMAATDNGNSTSNHVTTWGYNAFGGILPTKYGIHWAMEQYYNNGGQDWHEVHLQSHFANGDNVRHYSLEVKELGASAALSRATLTQRVNSFEIQDLSNNAIFGVGRADNVATSSTIAALAGGTPIFRLQETNSAATWDLQHDGSGGNITSGGLKVHSKYAASYNLVLDQAVGSANMGWLRSDGNGIQFGLYGSGAGSLANIFYAYDASFGRSWLRYLPTGNVQLGATDGTSDLGHDLQVFGTTKFEAFAGFAAGTTGAASINIPHGVAPTSPVNGDIWSTTSSVFARVNGATIDLAAAAPMAIGSAVTSGTAGSIPFIATGPVLAQNNASLFWDDSSTELGIGTNTPAAHIHVLSSAGGEHGITAEASSGGGSAVLSLVTNGGNTWKVKNEGLSGSPANTLTFNHTSIPRLIVDQEYIQANYAVRFAVISSSAGTLNMTTNVSSNYVFTGTTSTWTLPTVANTGSGRIIYIKNKGSGTITLNTNAGGNDLYTTTAVNTLAITAGQGVVLSCDGSTINLISQQ